MPGGAPRQPGLLGPEELLVGLQDPLHPRQTLHQVPATGRRRAPKSASLNLPLNCRVWHAGGQQRGVRPVQP